MLALFTLYANSNIIYDMAKKEDEEGKKEDDEKEEKKNKIVILPVLSSLQPSSSTA